MSLTQRFEATVRGGRIVRPGFFRAPDGSGVAYADSLKQAPADLDCVFCPEAIDESRIIDEIGSRACRQFVVIPAVPAYAHWDAQRVLTHSLIIPERHVEDDSHLTDEEYLARRRYVDHVRREQPDAVFQTYTRDSRSPSKSIPHLHTHLLELDPDPVTDFAFNADEGVTRLAFAELSPEQRAEIIRSRTDQ